MLRYLLIFACTIFISMPHQARADDYAERHIIGFSPDAHFFAFEQFGTDDPGSNFFSDIFVIDTKTTHYVKGTPFKYESIPCEKGCKLTVNDARRANLAKARPLLTKLKIAGNYSIFATNRLTELPKDAKQVEFASIHSANGGPYRTLKLKEFRLDGPPLKELGPITGFTLTISKTWDEGDVIFGGYPEIKIPRRKDGYPDYQNIPYYACSSGYFCAARYTIADVIMAVNGDAMVILIGVFFEGHNNAKGRFLAIARPSDVTGKLGVAH